MLRSLYGARFMRHIARARRTPQAAKSALRMPDIVDAPITTEADGIAMARLQRTLLEAQKKKQPPGGALDCYDGPFTIEGVSKVLWGNKDPETARAVLNWASCQPGFHYTSRMVTTMLRGLNAGGHLDEGRKLVFEEIRKKFKLTPDIYRTLAKCYMAAGEVADVREIIEEMQRDGMDPIENVPGYVFEFKFKDSGLQGMLQLFMEKVESGWVPSKSVSMELVIKLCGSKMTNEALKVFNAARENGTMLDETTYCVLIKDLCRVKQVDEVYRVTKLLLERGYPSCYSPPYRVVINALSDNGKVEEALEIFQAIHKENADLSGIHLVQGLCGLGKLDAAMDVLGRVKPGRSKDATPYNALITAFCKEDRLHDAKKVMDLMVSAGIAADGKISGALKVAHSKTI